MEFDPIAYLEGKGFKGRPSKGGAEYLYPCFFGCSQSASTPAKDWRLYVNSRDSWFYCFRCESQGGSYLLRKHFGDSEELGHADPTSFGSLRRREILEEATQRAHTALLHNDDMLLYLLNERGLSEETIAEARLGWIGNRWSLIGDITAPADEMKATGLVNDKGQDFFWHHLMIPYTHLGAVVQLRGKVLSGNAIGKYMTGPGERVRLYGADDAFQKDEAIVTEGEFDRLMLKQTLSGARDDRARRIGVVGWPGVNACPDEFERAVENARRVYLGFDSDDVGKQAAAKLREKYGNRFKIIELPDPIMGRKADWNEYLLPQPADVDDVWLKDHPHHGHNIHDVMNLISDAGGRRLFNIGEMSARWRTQETLTGGLQMGFDAMDRTIIGVKPGQVFVILAKTGAGKTVFLANMAYHQRNRNVMWISLEMTSEECYERLRRVFLFYNPLATDAEVDAAYSKLMVCDENRLNEQDFSDLIAEYELEMGCKPEAVYVDYLGYYARGQEGHSPYEKTSNAIMGLKGEAKKHGVALWTPHQVSRAGKEGRPLSMEDARDSGVVEETADFVLSLYRPGDAAEEAGTKEPDGKIRCTFLKSRHGGKGKSYSLQMDLLTLAIVEANTPEATRAVKHCNDYWRGRTYEELRRDQTQARQTQLTTTGVRP